MKNRRNKTFTMTLLSLMLWAFFSLSIASDTTENAGEKLKEKPVFEFPYIIGTMDVLEIQVWEEPNFSRQVLVRPDGKITLPLIGDIQAAGISTKGLQSLLTNKLKTYTKNPEVAVILVESNSKKFYIIGKIKRPGTYPLSPDMTVLQALAVTGGLEEWADKDSIRIIRRSGGKESVILFDYNKVLSGKNLEQNILLEPGDTIIVP
jgi:polysaccharide biosynthesis/export protein